MISSFPNTRRSLHWILGILCALILYTGCKNEQYIQAGDSLSTAYKKALRLYRAEDFRDAAKAFETVVNIARGTDYARSSYFYLAESYYESKQYLLAADAYNRFISLFPQAERRQEAAFKEALSYYQLSPRYKLDQTYTRRAIEKFRIYLARYPASERADQAGQYISEMRSKLAHKKYEAAQLYHRLDQYEAAIVYYNLTVDQYPETRWAELALVKEIGAYVEYAEHSIPVSRRERYQKAIETYEKYLQLFPNGEHRQMAEANVDDARAALADLGSPADGQTTSADQ